MVVFKFLFEVVEEGFGGGHFPLDGFGFVGGEAFEVGSYDVRVDLADETDSGIRLDGGDHLIED